MEVVREEGDKRLVREREREGIQYSHTKIQHTLAANSPWRGEEGHPHPASGFGAGRGEELQPLAAPLFL